MSGSHAGPLDYHPEMKKVVTSSPTVTLMVTRIPSTIIEEGVNNLFLECGTVLNLRLIVNKGGFAGIRGMNYAYVTLASSDEATLAMEKLNMQPPLNLGVALKPSEEERLKTREQDLLNRAFGSVNQEKLVVNRKESADESGSGFVAEEVSPEELVLQKEDCGITAEMLITEKDADAKLDEEVFMFNSPLVVAMMNKLPACCCGNESILVCSRCKLASYCSQVCQVAQWAGHRGECVGGPVVAVDGVDGKKEGELVKKRKVARKQSAEKLVNDENQDTSSARSTENSPLPDTMSSGLSSEFQDNLDRNQEIANEQSELANKETFQLLNANEALSSGGKPTTDKELGSGQVDEQAKMEIERSKSNLSSSEDLSGQPPALEMLEEQMLREKTDVVQEYIPGVDMAEDYLKQEIVLPVEEAEPVDDMSDLTDDSEDSSPPFHSFLKFKEQTDEKENKFNEVSDGTEHFEDALDVKPVDLSIDKKIEQSLVDSILEPPSVIPDAAELPTSLPTTWTRVVTSVPILDSDLFIVRIQGVEQEMLVRLAGVRLAEPWSAEIKKIMDVVLGEGREGQVELWIKSVGWDGDIQLVEIKDQDNNDIASLLADIKVMEKTDVTEDAKRADSNNNAAVDDNKSDEGVFPLVRQPEPLMVEDVERGLVMDGTLVRLRDIGDTSQVGLVRCMEEKERKWLEEVMELSDNRTSILSPQVGQLVAFVLQTRAGTRVARAEVIKLNDDNQKAQCQCLDYHDRRWESYENLFQPPPACLSIPPLCTKVELYGVPVFPRKEAKVMLEQVDQASLSQPLTLLCVKEGGMAGQVVELLDADGSSINKLLAKVLVAEIKSSDTTPSLTVVSDISTVLPPDYSLLTSYVPLPLHTCLPAIILHAESPTHLFVCQAAHWEELNRFQAHLQTVAANMDQGTTVQPVVGQLVMIRSGQDNLWYRGTVIKLHKSKAKIYCPDYGFVEKISVSSILPLGGSDVRRAYWASHCTLVDWGEGMQEANVMEVEKIKQMLPVTKQVELRVMEVDGVKFIIDIKGISRFERK